MKEGTLVTKVVMLLFAACLAVWFGVSLWRGMTDPLTTTVAYAYTVNNSVEAEGLLVRQEKVLPVQSGIADVVPEEGERVGAGQPVAYFYRNSQALGDRRQIQTLTLEAELLQYAIGLTDSDYGTAELEDAIVASAVALRSSTASGQFGQLETQVIELKRAVLKRDYAFGQEVDTSRLTQLNRELQTLNSHVNQNASVMTAPESGVFSAQVDGYESLLDPATASRFTADEALQLLNMDMQEAQEPVGKLITSDRWCFLTTLPEQQAQRLHVGDKLTVRFSGDFSMDVDMLVESVGGEQNGRSAVLLSSTRYLSSTTLLRRQTVEFIFDRYEGLRVPKTCVHILSSTQTDSQTGETQQVRTTGVYALVNGKTEFKQVEVLAEGSQFYVIKPVDQGRTTLRDGDQVILHAKELSNGKIMQE